METMSDPSADPNSDRPQGENTASAAAATARWTRLAVAIVAIVVVGIIAVAAGLWATIGGSQISFVGWLALIFGITVALSLWIGLMSLMFISNRRGYDDLGPPRR
jgi:hypothetical protein